MSLDISGILAVIAIAYLVNKYRPKKPKIGGKLIQLQAPPQSSKETRVTFSISPIDEEIIIVMPCDLYEAKREVFNCKFVKTGPDRYININMVKRVKFEEIV